MLTNTDTLLVTKNHVNTMYMDYEWTMNDKNLNMPANATHLGIKRDTSSKFGVKLVVPDRIQTARKTVYALMGAGLHGMNGINPMVSIHMIKCFVLPRSFIFSNISE
jgi:hypothetical protein